MSYLSKYGTRKFQEGGAMPAGPEAAPAAPAGPEAGGGGEEQVIALAQAAASGDPEAAAELGMMLAPMILEQAGAGGPEGAPAGPEGAPPEGGAPGGEPVFRRGGKFLGKK